MTGATMGWMHYDDVKNTNTPNQNFTNKANKFIGDEITKKKSGSKPFAGKAYCRFSLR